jgi:branched-chain amino acid transport system substrate-binding protein
MTSTLSGRGPFFAACLLMSSSAMAADVTIGGIFPLTGPAAPIGIEEQQGVQFAIDQINAAGGVDGNKAVALYEDSQGMPQVGVLSFNKLVDLQSVPVVISAFSSVSLAIAPLATRKKVLVMNAAAQSDKLAKASPYLINTIPLVGDETTGLVSYMVNTLGKKTAAIVYENAAAGIDAKDDFVTAFQGLGGKIVADESVEFGLTNYRPTLLKVASAKPDFVYFAVTQGHPTYIEQAAQVTGFPIGAGTTLVNPSYGYPGSMGWYQSAIQSQVSPAVESAFKQKFGAAAMSFYSREYYVATIVAFQALSRGKSKTGSYSGGAARAAIFDSGPFTADMTTIVFPHGNTAARGIEIQQYQQEGRKVMAVEAAK